MIYCGASGVRRAAAVVALLSLTLVLPAHAGKKKRDRAPEDLINVLLNPELSQWLIGAVARIASDEEIRSYLALTDDEAANEFIDAFWAERVDPEQAWPGNQVRDVFDARSDEADRLFAEGTQLGRRSERGVIHILFGEPQKRTYIQEEGRRSRTVEVWTYERKTVRGLDGSSPKAEYHFARHGGSTVEIQPARRSEFRRGRID